MAFSLGFELCTERGKVTMKKLSLGVLIITICLIIYENYYQYKAAKYYSYLKTNTLQLKVMLEETDREKEQKRYEEEKYYIGINVSEFEAASSMSLSNDYSKVSIVIPPRDVTAWLQKLKDVSGSNVEQLNSIRDNMGLVDVKYNVFSAFNVILGLIASIIAVYGFVKE